MAISERTAEGHQLFRPSSEENTVKVASQYEAKIPDPRLLDGMPLPKYLIEKFPRHLLGMPIVEIDPFYHDQKTFIIVGTNWVIHRFTTIESLWVLSPFNRLRWLLVRMVTHSFFQFFMFLVIVSLAVIIPVSRLFEEKKMFFLPFYWIFTIEVLIKILAYGFFLKSFSYLRNPWNWLDLILTCAGWYTECFVQDRTMYGIQSLRVLRIIHFFTFPRLLFSRMFRSLCVMKDLLIYGVFIFCLFAMFAQMQYQGLLLKNCDSNSTAIKYGQICTSKDLSNSMEMCTSSSTILCPVGFVCLENYGKGRSYCQSHFDNFFSSCLGIFRLTSRDYWDHLFAEITFASSSWNLLFFVIVITFLRFLLMNLITGYIAVSLNHFMDILENKLPINKNNLLVTSIQEFGNTANCEPVIIVEPRESRRRHRTSEPPHRIRHRMSEPTLGADRHESLLRHHRMSEAIILNNLNLEDRKRSYDDYGNDDETWFSDNESYVRDVESEESRSVHLSNAVMSCINKCFIWNCCGCWINFQKWLCSVVLSQFFNAFICLCITSNVVILTMDHHEMPDYFFDISFYSSRIFTLIYLVEVALKILALSPKYYFKDSWNIFEFLIVIGCLLELSIENISGLAIMRSFRMFRILRFARWWPGFGNLMKIITTNSIVLFVVVLLFATMGVFLFGSNYAIFANAINGDYPRWHMIDLTHSLLLVVRILCGEWMETLSTCRQSNGWTCIPFFLAVLAIGNLVIFHLFITMMMASIQSNHLCETHLDTSQNLFCIITDALRSLCAVKCSRVNLLSKKRKNPEENDEVTSSENCGIHEDICIPQQLTNVSDEVDRTIEPFCWSVCYTCWNSSSPNVAPNEQSIPSFQNLFTNFRQNVLNFINGRCINYGMVAFVVISSVPLCLKGNGFDSDGSIVNMISFVTDVAVAIIFSLDLLMSILSLGFKNYFSNSWSCFDFIITLLHLASLLTREIGFYEIPFIAFRPLKLIPRVEHLRVVVSALLFRISLLLDSILACGVFWLLFCITGMQLFAGRFYRCIINDSWYILTNGTLQRENCTSNNYTWSNANVNFDNIQNSFLALLHVSTLKGWIPILYSALDSVEEPYRPLRERTIHLGWFFVLFLIFGVFGCYALILSAFVKRTNDHKQKIIRNYIDLLMTDCQRRKYAVKKKTFFYMPSMGMPSFGGRKLPFVFRILNSHAFILVIAFLTLANAVTSVVLYNPPESDRIDSLYMHIDLAFHLAFVLEIVFKMTMYGRQFFKKAWNIYDCLLILFTTISYVCMVFHVVFFRTGLLSVLRLIRLIRWLKWVQRILSWICAVLPAILNVGAVMLVIMAAYAIIGMAWFRDAQVMPNYEEYHNFKTFFPSIIMLTEIGLGSGWDFVYQELSKVNLKAAILYMFSYLFICYFIIIGCGVVLLLEHYQFIERKLRLEITDDDLENYVATWQIFDRNATGNIKCEYLAHFLDALNPRLQVQLADNETFDKLDIPLISDNLVTFEDVFQALLNK